MQYFLSFKYICKYINYFKYICTSNVTTQISLLLSNNFYPVITYRIQNKKKATNYCVRFGYSSANRLPAQGVKLKKFSFRSFLLRKLQKTHDCKPCHCSSFDVDIKSFSFSCLGRVIVNKFSSRTHEDPRGSSGPSIALLAEDDHFEFEDSSARNGITCPREWRVISRSRREGRSENNRGED